LNTTEISGDNGAPIERFASRISTIDEKIITLAEAAAKLPKRRLGRNTHVSTLHRWATKGCRGMVLETIQIGGTRCTSREALQRFFERLSQPVEDRAASGGHRSRLRPERTLARRNHDAAVAGRKLAEMGA
jgi:hypothetical protein